jgi:hypothetical protein
MDATSTDTTTQLANATPEQFERFEVAAKASGHASGKSAANDGNLWSLTVAEAIAIVDEDAEAMSEEAADKAGRREQAGRSITG